MSDEQENQSPMDDPAADMALAKLTVPDIEQKVGMLSEAIPREQLLTWLMLSHVLLQRAKEIRRRIEGVAVDWINANGPFQCGDITYSVGKNKQVKCRDALRCMQLLLDACGGDVDKLCTFFRSEPFRYGACGNFLDQSQWNSVFTVEWQDKLVLKQTDERHLPEPRARGTFREEK